MTESKQYRIIDTEGIRNRMAKSLKKSLIELLSPKQNGTIEMDRNAPNKATNKATIKSMWKKAFRSLKTKEAAAGEKSDGGESTGSHRKSSRQSSFRKSLLRRKDSKERESDQETNDDLPEEEGRVVDPVFQHLKYARFIATRSESQDSGHSSDQSGPGHSSDQSGPGTSSGRPTKY